MAGFQGSDTQDSPKATMLVKRRVSWIAPSNAGIGAWGIMAMLGGIMAMAAVSSDLVPPCAGSLGGAGLRCPPARQCGAGESAVRRLLVLRGGAGDEMEDRDDGGVVAINPLDFQPDERFAQFANMTLAEFEEQLYDTAAAARENDWNDEDTMVDVGGDRDAEHDAAEDDGEGEASDEQDAVDISKMPAWMREDLEKQSVPMGPPRITSFLEKYQVSSLLHPCFMPACTPLVECSSSTRTRTYVNTYAELNPMNGLCRERIFSRTKCLLPGGGRGGGGRACRIGPAFDAG